MLLIDSGPTLTFESKHFTGVFCLLKSKSGCPLVDTLSYYSRILLLAEVEADTSGSAAVGPAPPMKTGTCRPQRRLLPGSNLVRFWTTVVMINDPLPVANVLVLLVLSESLIVNSRASLSVGELLVIF